MIINLLKLNKSGFIILNHLLVISMYLNKINIKKKTVLLQVSMRIVLDLGMFSLVRTTELPIWRAHFIY